MKVLEEFSEKLVIEDFRCWGRLPDKSVLHFIFEVIAGQQKKRNFRPTKGFNK